MRCLIVHNTRSGFGSSAIFEFERALVEEGDECVLRLLSKSQTTKSIVADAEDYDLVVISGGDGTTTSLLYELRNRDVTCCVFPSGTANLFFVNLGCATEPAAIARACRIGSTAKTDLGIVRFEDERGTKRQRPFSIMMGVGFDAQLMETALESKKTLGEAAYFTAALSNAHPPKLHFSITVDGKKYERDGISCLVANNATIQGDFQIAPGSSMTDGLLDVIILEQSEAVELLVPFFASFWDRKGTQIERPQIETFRGAHIRVDIDQPAPFEYDGETFGHMVRSYEARILPQANRVIVDTLSPYHSQDSPYNEANPRFEKAAIKAYPAPTLS